MSVVPRRSSSQFLSAHPPIPPLALADWIGIALTSTLLLLLSWVHSRHTIFWSDEIMGWLVVREPTMRQLLHSWWAGADSSGIFFYLFARPWLALFGATPLALRLFSATGVACAAALLWVCARRFYRVEVVAAILPATLLVDPTLVWQLANSRTYGVLLAAVALAALAFAIADPDRPLTRRLLLLTFAAHLLLVGSHILGPLYSAVLLAGLVARDLWQTRRIRPRLYLAGAAGWITLAVSLPNLRATMALGKPSFWTLKPHRHELAVGFTVFEPHLYFWALTLLLMTLTAWAARRHLSPRTSLIPPADRTRIALILTLFSCVPTLFLISRLTTSVFVDRYLLPVLLADVLLLCELVSRLLLLLEIGPRIHHALFGLMLLILIRITYHDLPLRAGELPHTDYTRGLVDLIPPGTPAILTDPGIFAEMVFYQNARATFLVPVDWPVVLHSHNPGDVSGAHEMDNWKSLGYFASQIQPTAQILAENPRFLVIAPAATGSAWFDRRILPSPSLRVTDLGIRTEADLRFHLWLVKRLDPSLAPALSGAPPPPA